MLKLTQRWLVAAAICMLAYALAAPGMAQTNSADKATDKSKTSDTDSEKSDSATDSEKDEKAKEKKKSESGTLSLLPTDKSASSKSKDGELEGGVTAEKRMGGKPASGTKAKPRAGDITGSDIEPIESAGNANASTAGAGTLSGNGSAITRGGGNKPAANKKQQPKQAAVTQSKPVTPETVPQKNNAQQNIPAAANTNATKPASNTAGSDTKQVSAPAKKSNTETKAQGSAKSTAQESLPAVNSNRGVVTYPGGRNATKSGNTGVAPGGAIAAGYTSPVRNASTPQVMSFRVGDGAELLAAAGTLAGNAGEGGANAGGGMQGGGGVIAALSVAAGIAWRGLLILLFLAALVLAVVQVKRSGILQKLAAGIAELKTAPATAAAAGKAKQTDETVRSAEAKQTSYAAAKPARAAEQAPSEKVPTPEPQPEEAITGAHPEAKPEAGATAEGQSQHMKLLETISLGKDRQISIVEVGGEALVLGITDSQVSLLEKVHLDAAPADYRSAVDNIIELETARHNGTTGNNGTTATPTGTHPK